ncbi:hypothetical protein HDV01_000326 [Terramyces sp. JEL0728]|nr:hypothetical protein HDV01_000326 [Terramyces sp. JEL0728]
MISEITYVVTAVSLFTSILTVSIFLSNNYRSKPLSKIIALLCIPPILDVVGRLPILTYKATNMFLFADLYSTVIVTIVIQAVSFLNFATFHLFTVFNLAPKFNVSRVIVINFCISLVANCLFFPCKFSADPNTFYLAYLVVLGLWIIGVLISGTAIGFYIPVVISKAQKRTKNNTLHGLIHVRYALLALSVMDWLGVGIYLYEVLYIDDSKDIINAEMEALPYDIIATSVAGLHFTILTHVYHYTYLVTSKIKEERKKSQINIKRRKTARFQALSYNIIATAVAGIHFALLSHVFYYTYMVTMKIKEERKKSQMNMKRKKHFEGDQDQIPDISRAHDEDDAISASVVN